VFPRIITTDREQGSPSRTMLPLAFARLKTHVASLVWTNGVVSEIEVKPAQRVCEMADLKTSKSVAYARTRRAQLWKLLQRQKFL
jgi:hypothetical protein